MTLAIAVLLLGSGMTATALAQTGAPAAERFVLSGLVVFDDGEGVAWLQEPTLTRDQVVSLRRGDRVGPWTLTRLLDNRVELEGPGGKVLVPLHNAGGAGVASGGPATPRARTSPPGQLGAPAADPAATAAAAAPPAAYSSRRALTAGRRGGAQEAAGVQESAQPTASAEARAEALLGAKRRTLAGTRGPDGLPVGSAAGPQGPGISGGPAAQPGGVGTIYIPVGDPRRRESLQQLFGPR